MRVSICCSFLADGLSWHAILDASKHFNLYLNRASFPSVISFMYAVVQYFPGCLFVQNFSPRTKIIGFHVMYSQS